MKIPPNSNNCKVVLKIITLILLLMPRLLCASSHLVIEGITIISPSETSISSFVGNIYIKNGKIEKVTSSRNSRLKNYEIISGKGLYAIPGLIDSHVHVDSIPGIDPERTQEYQDMVAAYQKQMPRSYLYYGYTTLIDLFKANKNQFNSQPVHPDIYDCGGGITVENGYPMSTLSKREQNEWTKNTYQKKLKANISPKHRTPAASVKSAISNGAVCIKTYYESGFGVDRNLPLPNIENINELSEVAHKNKLPVFIHANSLIAQQFAIETNIDNFAHGMWNWGELDGEKGLPAPVKTILSEVISRNIGYQPTVQVPIGLSALADDSYFNDKNILKVMPKLLIDWYQTKSGQWYAEDLVGKNSKDIIHKRIVTKVDQVKRTLKYLADNKAKLLFGTDTPSSPTYGNLPGYNGYLEMRQWYSAGVPLEIILKAATINNAKELRMDNRYGSIEAGKVANILILKKNPLKTVDAYDSIIFVILHGKKFRREAFLASSNNSLSE